MCFIVAKDSEDPKRNNESHLRNSDLFGDSNLRELGVSGRAKAHFNHR